MVWISCDVFIRLSFWRHPFTAEPWLSVFISIIKTHLDYVLTLSKSRWFQKKCNNDFIPNIQVENNSFSEKPVFEFFFNVSPLEAVWVGFYNWTSVEGAFRQYSELHDERQVNRCYRFHNLTNWNLTDYNFTPLYSSDVCTDVQCDKLNIYSKGVSLFANAVCRQCYSCCLLQASDADRGLTDYSLHMWTLITSCVRCSCGSVVEHCVSSAKGCGFNSQGTHTDNNV